MSLVAGVIVTAAPLMVRKAGGAGVRVGRPGFRAGGEHKGVGFELARCWSELPGKSTTNGSGTSKQ